MNSGELRLRAGLASGRLLVPARLTGYATDESRWLKATNFDALSLRLPFLALTAIAALIPAERLDLQKRDGQGPGIRTLADLDSAGCKSELSPGRNRSDLPISQRR